MFIDCWTHLSASNKKKSHQKKKRNMVLEEAPGMTWRMRQKIEKWEKDHYPSGVPDPLVNTEEEIERYKRDRQRRVNLLWSYEVEDARMQGKLKAVKESAYRDEIGDRDGSREKGRQAFFVTVNPSSDVDVATFTAAVSKYVDQKHVVAAEYVYEQRGSTETEAGQGMHVHALVTTSTNTADFKKRTQAKFAKLCGNEKHVHISFVRPEWMEDKREYMRGKKNGEGKDVKVGIDQIWRLREKLEPYYKKDGEQEEDRRSINSRSGSQEVHEEDCGSTVT